MPARELYQIIIDDEAAVAEAVAAGSGGSVGAARDDGDQPYYFNWQLAVDVDFQMPFLATHSSMAALQLHRDQSVRSLAVNMRRAFAGIVGGNVRESGIRLVQEFGPFELNGDPELIAALDELLAQFIQQGRMKLADPSQYVPCYRIA